MATKRTKDHTLDTPRKLQCREMPLNMDKLIEDFDNKLSLCQKINNKKRKVMFAPTDKERIDDLEKKTEQLEEQITKLTKLIFINKSDDKYWDSVVN